MTPKATASARDTSALAASLYAIGLLFVVIPPWDVLVSVVGGTPAPGTARWRFGAVGLVSTQLPLVLLGVLLILVAADLKGHRWIARTVGVLCGLASTVLLAAAVLLVLDALEIRRDIAEQFVRAYDITAVKTLFATVMSAVTGVLLLIASFRLVGRRAVQQGEGAARKSPIVGGRGTNALEAGRQT